MSNHYSEIWNDAWFSKTLSFGKPGDFPCLITGLTPSAAASTVGEISLGKNKKSLIICPSDAGAQKFCDDLTALFGDGKTVYIPSKELNFHSENTTSHEYETERLCAFSKILQGNYTFAVLSSECLLTPTVPADVLKKLSFTLSKNMEITIERLISLLLSCGYSRRELVDGTGEFSVRGGIVDIFPAGEQNPVRIEFFGDEIDTLSYFSAENQRRTEYTDNITVFPCNETVYDKDILKDKISALPESVSEKDIETLSSDMPLGSADKYIPLIYGKHAVWDFFGECLVFAHLPFEIKEALNSSYDNHILEIKELLKDGVISSEISDIYHSPADVVSFLENSETYLADNFARSLNFIKVKNLIASEITALPGLPYSEEELTEDLKDYIKSGVSPVVFCGTEKSAENFKNILKNYNIDADKSENISGINGKVVLHTGILSGNFKTSQNGTAFLTVSGAKSSTPRKRIFKKGKEISSAYDLTVGEAIVHATHGIGIFRGIVKMENQNIQKDYIKIQYQGADVLYVPVSGLDLVSKYIGPGDSENIRLNKLSGIEWKNTKARVRHELEDMADELISLYSKRLQMKGTAFSPDTEWQKEFEEKFEYEETDDQLKCISEIKSDMEKPVPMDRLLCGDVGFGKTEVAFRAAFKCVLEGKQVAILAPTTILAFQHYQTALRRFDGYPINIELLSRFRTARQQKEIIKNLRDGKVDILIGTHRIISDDVSFPDLGLLVVDEEQRFGVKHKEKLKEKFTCVDVLTLSATPIPRTLNMALSGIRDMSMIEEPPRDRLPVQTFVTEQNDGIIAEAIRRELRRGGSCFYLHNRVESIISCASHISSIVPEARIGIAHGKMNEDDLSDIFNSLINGDIDVLVCTTIIETGIDIPTCNTLIIEDSDRMGLSQLYQIRGRVGRSAKRAYAYFMFKPQKVLTEIAAKRLGAIRDFTQFGSGFKIAMRDLEIRGAGSVLGAHQHGHMENVGYDMYMKLLKQAVDLRQGITPKSEESDCLMDMRMNAFIPKDYIDSNSIRMEIYKRIADIETREDAEDVIDELIDRFGDVPNEVMGLIDTSFFRKRAIIFGVTEIKETADSVLFYMPQLGAEKIEPLVSKFKNRFMLSLGSKPYFAVKKAENTGLATVKEVFSEI